MFKIYNSEAIDQKSRFNNAIIAGLVATIISVIAYVLFNKLIGRWEFQIAFLAIGYFIGTTIMKYGKGVQPKFAILAASLTALAIILGDLFSIYGLALLTHPSFILPGMISIIGSYASLNISSLLGLFFRISGIYLAYTKGRIF
ncbi:MAG: hypothetical protein WBO70_07625 [Erysipelotrichaceae bacterium]